MELWKLLRGTFMLSTSTFACIHSGFFLPHTTSIHTPNLICHAQVKFNKIMIYNVYICIQYMYIIYIQCIYMAHLWYTVLQLNWALNHLSMVLTSCSSLIMKGCFLILWVVRGRRIHLLCKVIRWPVWSNATKITKTKISSVCCTHQPVQASN